MCGHCSSACFQPSPTIYSIFYLILVSMSNHTRRPTLFVTGFPNGMRARELAYEFEKYGEIIRCDVPAQPASRNKRYAFVEYVHEDDAVQALGRLSGEHLQGKALIVEWAKRTPGSRWRLGSANDDNDKEVEDRERDREHRDRDHDGRSRRDSRPEPYRTPPRRTDRSRSPLRRNHDSEGHRSDRTRDSGRRRSHSRSPRSNRRRDNSPNRDKYENGSSRDKDSHHSRRRDGTPPRRNSRRDYDRY